MLFSRLHGSGIVDASKMKNCLRNLGGGKKDKAPHERYECALGFQPA